MLGAGLDLLDQGLTVFDAELRMVAWNAAFLRLLDSPNPSRGRVYPSKTSSASMPSAVTTAPAIRRSRWPSGRPGAELPAPHHRAHPPQRAHPVDPRLSAASPGFHHCVYRRSAEQRRAAEQISRHQGRARRTHRVPHRSPDLGQIRELTAAVDSKLAITQALRRSEQRLREITDAIPAAIAYVDKDRIYRYANKGYAGWFGGPPSRCPATGCRRSSRGALRHHLGRRGLGDGRRADQLRIPPHRP